MSEPTLFTHGHDAEERRRVLVVRAGYEAFIIGVTLITVINSVLLVTDMSDDAQAVAWSINRMLSVMLIADALARFFHPTGRLRWLVHGLGWLIFIGSLPIPFFGVARLIATGVTLRRLRRHDFVVAGANVATQRAQSTFLGIVLIAIVVLEVAGIMVLRAESTSPEANIKTAQDALWWEYVTMATVGYGDRYPVTEDGRLVGIVVMTVGVALFTTLTGFLADWFRRPHTRAAEPLPMTDDREANLRHMVADMRNAIEAKAAADQAALSELRARLDAIERRLP